MIIRFEKYWEELISGGRLDEGLRARLNGSMHTQIVSLIVGSGCVMLASWTAFFCTKNLMLFWLAMTISCIAMFRLSVSFVYRRHDAPEKLVWLHNLYPLAAIGIAACVGLTACITLLIGAPGPVQMLITTYAMTFVVDIAMRNSGRPIVALVQLVATTLPIVVALISLGHIAAYILAIIIPCMTAGMAAVTVKLFRTMTQQANQATELRDMADLLERQAREDPVTGLVNRAGLEPALEPLVAQLAENEQLVLIWVDLHRFKEVNDMLGHAAGDMMLREMGRRLIKTAPDGAAVARFGSDEFVVGARVSDRRAAERLCQQLCEASAQPVRVAGQRIESGAAIGAALMPEDEPTLEKVMQSADLALFNAKLGGRHKVRFFNNAMTRALARRKELESELRSAIQKDELSIYFQPIVDLATGKVRCFEALLRWFHPEKGELRPDEFIPVAEETGLIITLGNWVTAQAARTAATWPDDVMLAVNLSPVQIRAPGAALGILAAIKDAGLDPRRLELEVTESLFLEDDANTTRFMQDLSSKGVRFALDDFGTGYSALHYINKYPFRKIKVDRSFVSGPDHGPKSDAIIRAVAEMGTTLGMEIVAEGLETIGQVQFVRQAGCTLGQGYFFSRAVPDYLAAILLAEEDEKLDCKRQAS